MAKKKSLKQALFMAIISIVACLSMFAGTTFAWFTDSVTSSNNVIKAGNLDIVMRYSNDKSGEWKVFDKDTNVFMKDALWEPGHTEIIRFEISNAGSLALKYQFGVYINNEQGSVNVEGDDFKLSEYINYGFVAGELASDISRDAAIAAVKNNATNLQTEYNTGKVGMLKLNPTEKDVFTMVVYMPTSVGDEANAKKDAPVPTINLGISLHATQVEADTESDSFGPDYDKDAWAEGMKVYTASDLQAALSSGFNVKLENDINIDTPIVIPAPQSTANVYSLRRAIQYQEIDLNGKKLVGNMHKSVGSVIKNEGNLYIKNGTISSTAANGGSTVVNNGNMIVENATLNGATNADNSWPAYTINNIGVMEISNTKITSVHGAVCSYGEGAIVTLNDSEIDMTGIPGFTSHGIYTDSNGYVVVNGGNYVNHATDQDGTGASIINGAVIVNSGNFVGRIEKYYGTPVIAGGTFSVDPKDFLVENCKTAKNNGSYWVINSDKEYTADGVLQDKTTNAYEIHNVAGLKWLASEVNGGDTFAGKTVLLMNDIDLANEEWNPIGTGAGFYGKFDGNNKTISNLLITGTKNTVGLFANTYNGEIKNLTVNNAKVSGRLNVGVVAGNPYTSKYTNVTVTGHVEVNGFSYVGTVGGKNAYGDWTDVTVNVDETSYVKAISTEYDPDSKYADENGNVSYRTYVGGVVGFNGEGGHTFKNITTNIDVIGDVCDIGGAFGIAHYGNKIENVVCEGDVISLGEADELGGIAGVWHNGGANVEFTNCKFEGTISDVNGNVSDCDIVGGAYSTSGTGKLIIDGVTTVVVDSVERLTSALVDNSTIIVNATIEDATIKLPTSLENVTIKGGTFKNTEIMSYDGNSINYVGLTFDGGNFENSRIIFTGWRGGEVNVKDLTVTNCTFKNLDDETNSAPVHINMDADEAVENFTFTNNVIDGAIGGSKSGVYAQITGKVTFTNNVINNVAFRPYVIQITTDDGIDDEFIVSGNTFSGSSAGRAQGLGNNNEGTDTVKLVVSENIFKDITESQQICYWDFNPETTTADLSKNYYDIDITANPNRIYYNKAASSVEDLIEMGIYPFYTELNEDGTINTNSLVEVPQD